MIKWVVALLSLAGCAGAELSDDQRLALASGMQSVSQGYYAMAVANTPRTINCLGCY